MEKVNLSLNVYFTYMKLLVKLMLNLWSRIGLMHGNELNEKNCACLWSLILSYEFQLNMW